MVPSAFPCLPPAALQLEKKYFILRTDKTKKQTKTKPNQTKKILKRKQNQGILHFSTTVRENLRKMLTLAKLSPKGRMYYLDMDNSCRAWAEVQSRILTSSFRCSPTAPTHLLLHNIPLVSQPDNNFYTSQMRAWSLIHPLCHISYILPSPGSNTNSEANKPLLPQKQSPIPCSDQHLSLKDPACQWWGSQPSWGLLSWFPGFQQNTLEKIHTTWLRSFIFEDNRRKQWFPFLFPFHRVLQTCTQCMKLPQAMAPDAFLDKRHWCGARSLTKRRIFLSEQHTHSAWQQLQRKETKACSPHR